MQLGESADPEILSMKSLSLLTKNFQMIGRAGESLPDFPPATHAAQSNILQNGNTLTRFTSVGEAVAGIPAGDPDNVRSGRHVGESCHQTTSSAPCRWTITTTGPNLRHPSGTGTFTNRERACLQGFPRNHLFSGPNVERRKQIGNAVPPSVGAQILGMIKRSLWKTDGIVASGMNIQKA